MQLFWLVILVELILFIFILYPYLTSFRLLRRGEYGRALKWASYLRITGKLIPSYAVEADRIASACYICLGDPPRALERAEAAVQRARRWRMRRLLVASELALGEAQLRLGEYQEAFDTFESARSYRVRSRVWGQVLALDSAAALVNLGNILRARSTIEAVLSAGRLRPVVHAIACCNLSACHFYDGDTEAALAALGRTDREKPLMGHWTGWRDALRMRFLLDLGRVEEAARLEPAVRKAAAAEGVFPAAGAHHSLARLRLARGDLNGARHHAEISADLDPTPNGRAGPLLAQAEVFARMGNSHRAAVLCREVEECAAIEFYRRRARDLRSSLGRLNEISATT